MQTCKLHIVALPYYEVGENLSAFYAEALGRGMTLRPDPTNGHDVNAIRAYDWQGRHVGFVAGHDLERAWKALRGSGRRSLRGHIVEKTEEHKCVVFECQVEAMADDVDLYHSAAFLSWTYSGPLLKPTDEMVKLEFMQEELTERLDEYERWSPTERDDFMLLAERFCELSKLDLSGDMDAYRRRLYLRLLALKDKGFRELTEDLRMAFGRTGRESHGGRVLDYWMGVLKSIDTVRQLLEQRHEYDAGQVRRQLEAFPEGMYQVWLENRGRFVSRLLYLHVPRTVLWQFVSGIAFCEAVSSLEKSSHERQESHRHQQLRDTDEYKTALAEMKSGLGKSHLRLDTIADCILRLPTVDLQYKAFQQVNTLLTGTPWSTKAEEVLNKMFCKVKEQQDRQQEMEANMKKAAARPSVTMNVELIRGNKTDIGTNYGPNIDNHDGGTVELPSGAVPDSLPQSDGDKEQ